MFAGRLSAVPSDTLTIGVDARALTVDHLRGMGNYLCGMIGALAADQSLAWQFFSDRPDLPFHSPLPAQHLAPLAALDCPGFRFHSWEQAVLPFAAKRRGVDVLHCTGNTAPLWQPVPIVITIHDTMIWDRNEAIAGGFYRDTLLPWSYARAAAIITISEQSKRDILRLWPALVPKLHVIPHGIDPAFLSAQPAPLEDALRAAGIRAPYLLYCGGTMPRKRLAWAVEIFAALDDPALQLVVLGVPESDHAGMRETLAPALRARVLRAFRHAIGHAAALSECCRAALPDALRRLRLSSARSASGRHAGADERARQPRRARGTGRHRPRARGSCRLDRSGASRARSEAQGEQQ
jgi:alpha-1,3-rhamnosyl/mannosyltransferase